MFLFVCSYVLLYLKFVFTVFVATWFVLALYCYLLDAYIKSKIRKINDALDSDPVDVDLLRKLMCTSEGCMTNDLRCKVWPKLLNINVFNTQRKKKGKNIHFFFCLVNKKH